MTLLELAARDMHGLLSGAVRRRPQAFKPRKIAKITDWEGMRRRLREALDLSDTIRSHTDPGPRHAADAMRC